MKILLHLIDYIYTETGSLRPLFNKDTVL